MYLRLRHRIWWAYHSISPRLRPFLGKVEFAQPTGETDKARARVVAAALEVEWRQRLEEAKGAARVPFWERLERAELAWEGKAPPERPEKVEAIQFDSRLDDWLLTRTADRNKTRHMKRATVTKFTIKFPTLAAVTRPAVQKWVDDQVGAGVAIKTIQRGLSELRGYWAYLEAHGVVGEDHQPFIKLSIAAPPGAGWSSFAADQVAALVTAAEAAEDQELADLIRVSAWTGGRLEEVVTVRVEDVDADRLVLRGTKTEAAPRQIAVHPSLAPTLQRLAGKRKSGFLFADLTENKFGDRSNAIGKRFGHLKTKCGFGKEYVFHSIRKTFSNILWSAGVQRELISQLMGHKTANITIDVYAKDPQFATKRRAIVKLKYPSPV